MMIPLLLNIKASKFKNGLCMERFYTHVGISRQGFKKLVTKRKTEEKMMASIILLVNQYRLDIDRRAGSRSLYYNLDIKSKYQIGVNKFEKLMATYGLTLLPMRINVVTTQSSSQSWNYDNLINGLIISDINVLVVGDLTYVSIGKYSYYFFCLLDVYSARIVGYHLGERMRKEEALQAYDMWVNLRSKKLILDCIHHTDGGSQYFSKAYVARMKQHQLRISVAQNCLENAYAEQRNATLKHHLIPTLNASKGAQLKMEIDRIINNYNHVRKQENLGWLSPVDYESSLKISKKRKPMKLYDHKTIKK